MKCQKHVWCQKKTPRKVSFRTKPKLIFTQYVTADVPKMNSYTDQIYSKDKMQNLMFYIKTTPPYEYRDYCETWRRLTALWLPFLITL